MAKNQHRWKLSLDEGKVRLLEGLGLDLRWSWETDSKSKAPYPINTDHVLGEIWKDLHPQPDRTRRIKPRGPRKVKRFADLFDEGIIKKVYEQQHDGSYEAALRLAGARRRGSSKAFNNIMKAARADYEISLYGHHVIPRPKIHFLHRELLDLAADLQLDALTNQGLEEFFDDVCPCSNRHNAEAIRKLRKRKARTSSSS